MQRLNWVQRLQTITQAGLTYARDPYDRERFQQLQARAFADGAAAGLEREHTRRAPVHSIATRYRNTIRLLRETCRLYKRAITDSKRFGLIKNEFSFDSWVENRFLKQALQVQKLEGYWSPYDTEGKAKA
jgi:hypothetical protein